MAPYFQDIRISNVVCYGAGTGVKAGGILGLDNVKDIEISNSTIMYYTTGQQIDEKTAKPEVDQCASHTRKAIT